MAAEWWRVNRWWTVGYGEGEEDGERERERELSKRTMSDSVRVAARSHSPLPSRLGIGGSQRGRSSR